MKIIEAQPDIPYILTQFENTVEKLETIPTIPAVAQKLMSITSSAEFSMDEVERLIASDQAISVRLMRVASSATFSPRPVTSVRGALIRVGMRNVRKLVLAAAVIGSKKISAFNKAIWVHSLRVASATEALADGLKLNIEDPFICGLLHDFGIVALDRILGETYRNVVAEPGTDEHLESERSSFAFDHGDMGAILAREWNLFPTLCAVMQLHHEPFAAPEVASPEASTAVYCVSLARQLVLDLERLATDECVELCIRLRVDPAKVVSAIDVGNQNFIERYASLIGG